MALARLKKAVDMIHVNMGFVEIDMSVYASLLQWCVEIKALAEGKRIQVHITKRGYKPDVYLQTKFLILYVKCGLIADAREMFKKMSERNVVSWNAIISGYVQQGNPTEALAVFLQMQMQMQREGQRVDPFTLASVLRACALEDKKAKTKHKIREVHLQIYRNGFEWDVVLLSTLIDAYAKSGDMDYAGQVFDKMSQRNVVSWTAMITGYAKCGRLADALNVFEAMPERDVVSWNAMIEGYAQHRLGEEALMLYTQMQRVGVKQSASTFLSVLRACSDLAALEQASHRHSRHLTECLTETSSHGLQ